MKTKYVVGFLHDDHRIVLIKKNRPLWQKGNLNGVGGHVEDYDADPHAAMVREFHEETGVMTDSWEPVVTLRGALAEIYVFAKYDHDNQLYDVETKTDEVVRWYWIEDLYDLRTLENLKWIVPLVLQRHKYKEAVIDFHGDA